MTTPEATSDHDPKSLVEALRKEAFLVIQNTGGAQKLPDILKRVGDPRLLDVPIDKDDYQDSLLEWSIRECALECARILIDSGADPMQSRLGAGVLSLHVLACNTGGMSKQTVRGFVELLSAAGADFDVKDDRGWTPLHHAIHAGSPWFAEILIEHGVWIDPLLLDPERQAEILPDDREEDYPYAVEALRVALRVARSLALQQQIISAMPDGDEPTAKSSPAMTL